MDQLQNAREVALEQKHRDIARFKKTLKEPSKRGGEYILWEFESKGWDE